MVNIVVAKYQEDTEWINKVKHKVTVYDKREEIYDERNGRIEGSIILKNKGREGETFLYHIVHNYDKLDEVTVFLQGNPFEHVHLLAGKREELDDEEIDVVIDKMNDEITDESEFTSFYQIIYNDPDGTNNVSAKQACKEYYGKDFDNFTLSPGAQYIVPKKYILSRPLSFWKKLQEAMYKEELDGYCQEQLWYYAYTHKMNNIVKDYKTEYNILENLHSFHYTPYSYFKNRGIDIIEKGKSFYQKIKDFILCKFK